VRVRHPERQFAVVYSKRGARYWRLAGSQLSYERRCAAVALNTNRSQRGSTPHTECLRQFRASVAPDQFDWALLCTMAAGYLAHLARDANRNYTWTLIL
jgi:hypothetical protein